MKEFIIKHPIISVILFVAALKTVQEALMKPPIMIKVVRLDDKEKTKEKKVEKETVVEDKSEE